ncbi:bifunctional folylpolyglutamate synthase/dihydrofolate synthase [Fonticella tunisiensis]|uniref:Dihydrofolate synthase/folylpolyglutamate synthase n=1 Tax=Fonticella tunisiensis TaxID=1096341 RepID=A0A4R7KT75_9CLOT|nr:folylpolyglutamate synthase/dihydrofolate synthase family protein [Fonticella tunisiensis]TDT61078.1 dihydrofolate synthase/folylpolyglutamate synthase [Fonticella tunisiensis]
MNYNEALKFIENTGKFGMNLGLQRIERLCELFGNPEKDLRFIHVAGTNGKGSTTTFISEILMAQGYKVGIYTSPYIERFTERIKINRNEIGEDDVARLVEEIKPNIERAISEGLEHPTEFEIITACAFKYFKEQEADFVVLEVGLGGRFDATNVVKPVLSVITTISYDHTNILGDTLSKIAFEKAGIIKEFVPVVIYPQEDEAMEVILKVAKDKNAPVYLVEDYDYEIVKNSIDGIVFNVKGKSTYKNLHLSMLGEHQIRNSMTAIAAIEAMREMGYEISGGSIYNGLKNAIWPGRFEVVNKAPCIILDGAHNMQGMEVLVKSIKKYFHDKKVRVVTGMLRDKDYIHMVNELLKITKSFITVAPDSPRALSSKELKGVIEGCGGDALAVNSIEDAVKIGLEITGEDEVLLFCGSLYMIGAARRILRVLLNRETF